MYKIALALVIGVGLGSIATYNLKPEALGSKFAAPPVRDVQHVPEISVAEAEVHRRDRYESIKTIEDMLALPTDFAETEALYVIAGRADASGVQDLIFQAARVSDRTDRNAALSILLMRLTELDPYSALAIARDPALGSISAHESSVWATWGRLDFDEALRAATEGSFAEKNIAAQALYVSIRNLDAEKSEAINSALGIKPGRNVRGQQIYALADKSVADAIRFIESQSSLAEQREQMGWLAHYLSRSSQAGQSNYAELIQSQGNRAAFEQSMASYGVQADPEVALAKYLAQPGNQQHQIQMHSALQSLAQQDPDKALAYVDRISDDSIRQSMGFVVASTLAASDPQGALAWVRENDKSVGQSTLTGIIGQIAQQDPQLAMTEAQSIQDSAGRERAIGMVVMVVSQNDPPNAAKMLGLMGDSNTRRSLVSQLGQQWAATDFESAVQWVSSLSTGDQQRALQGMGQLLARSNVDRAIELLDQFPTSGPRNLKIQITQNLAQQRSVEAAQAFISKYKGTEEYPRLQMTVISNIANSDPDRAMQMAESIPQENLRDQLYATIVARKANEDPQQALQWMESISNSAQRQQAISQIVMTWHSKSPSQASSWVSSLPRGATRDDAIVAMTIARAGQGQDARQLIDTIDDTAKRKRATLGLIQSLMYTDTLEAERLLNELELTDTERLQYQQMLDRTQYIGVSID